MPSAESTIVNKLGLHARAAAKLTHLAGSYKSEIWLSRSGRRVNAESIMGGMVLAARRGAPEAGEAEVARCDAAMTTAQEGLAALKAHIPAGSPAEFEAFLDLHRMILN